MRKTALGATLALVLAMAPLALFATSAVAAVGSATVRVMNVTYTNVPTIDVYIDGIQSVNDLAIGNGVDIQVADGTHTLNVCSANSTHVDGAGNCLNASDNNVTKPPAATNVGTPNQQISVAGGANYSLAISGDGILFPANDQSITGLGEFRYTVHNAVPSFLRTGSFDVCIGGTKVVHDLGSGETQVVSVTAQQDAGYAVFHPSTSDNDCASPNANVSFAAGTNFVQTIAPRRRSRRVAQAAPRCSWSARTLSRTTPTRWRSAPASSGSRVSSRR